MKGIILAGGSGTRLYPLTRVVNKQFLPIYDKPLIYYPLSVLMLAGVRDILFVSTPEDLPRLRSHFGDGAWLGLSFSYLEQPTPGGLAQPFILAKDFIGNDPVAMILGDNIFFGHGLPDILQNAARMDSGGIVFGYPVKDPMRFGVIEFDAQGNVLSIEEKPEHPKSRYAQTGLYFYDNNVVSLAEDLKPSPRGELEITDLNNVYLAQKKLQVEVFGRGFAWFDAGTHDALLEASNYIRTVQDRQSFKISCIEEIAYTLKYIDAAQLEKLAHASLKSGYGSYLLQILEDEKHLGIMGSDRIHHLRATKHA